MKKLMLMGCLLGFLIGTGTGVAQNSPWPSILWRASVAAVIAGFLLRWWGQAWINGLAEVTREKLAVADALENQRAEKTR